MKITISPSYLLIILILLIGNLSLCSFSLVPVPNKVEQPPLEKKKLSQEEKRQKHLQKRQNRLYERFEKAKTSKKRLFLQKKIRKVEQQQSSNPATRMSTASFITILLSFIVGLGFIFMTPYFKVFLIVELVIAIAALVLSIIALVLAKKNPEGSLKGLAITALVMSILFLLATLYFLIVLAVLRVI